MKKIRMMMAAALGVLVSCGSVKSGEEVVAASRDSKVVVAYVTSWSEVMPDPQYMTHINYAFGHVNESFNGVKIDNEERLRQIVDLRKQKPELKVLLSIGGWGSGRFSEMAANDEYRRAFAADCDRVVKEFALDGIDIDWEYPTSSMANISSSPDDTENFTLLMQDIRAAIGNEKELTLATVASARYIDFKAILPSVDFVNIMAYDMASAPKHHSALYPSGHSGDITSDGAVTAHLKAGVPPSKLVMGMPFYGRGGDGYPSFQDYNKVGNTDTQYTEKWDEVAQVPYLADKNDTLVFGFENPRSLAIKCQYILDKDLLGGMYWDYSGDNEQGDLRRTVAENLLGKPHKAKVLVLTERGGQHGGFTDAGLRWLAAEGAKGNFSITEINNARNITEAYLSQFSLVIQLDFPPYTWPKEAEDAFVKYIEEGRGGWIGFHHATLLGEFDGYPMWQWFSDFMGGVRFKNYIAPLADGTLIVEDKQHPVMKDVPASFVVPDDEWYTYDKSPRPNVHVLANVDESSYTPASDIKMGDHPVVWVNESKKARNVYFQIGHSSKLYETEGFTTMFRNAINWTLER
ncbi:MULTISPECIES: glycosyl hydrolase family 18 protein [Bacteroides]|jgi:chitinase|uniref:chitinase n=1 Tax=Bacteroides uniformis TaxID=820 RepID=A0A3E4XPU9_BACUN|nr:MULTISPECIES: glycosyl hydrolase family 18 protein [Bacteroides]MBV3893992.1 ThuA domain-containing protein [Bacteroides uniformis]MBV3898165.1 ThuA domain-containing protein [Bacteroides uniformis]MBV3915943.1 ThuA domain-containing protein [Bacteroides uniformis]MBV3978700.1 ThuA domain-containing protein [Bacteroides uniformis]MBV3991667.1 ThuA domain-containing protein [Bacteroides uniformis]